MSTRTETAETDVADEFGMRLPEGKTCGDCRYFSYCDHLFQCKPANTVCDWAPSKFRQRTTK